jgi:hypothetical protein
MPNRSPSRFLATTAVILAAASVLLYACRESAEAPPPPTPPKTFHLTVSAAGSSANGSLATNRGGVACAVSYSAGAVTTSGTCTADLDSGVVVTITATPPPSGAVAWTGCDAPLTDAPLTCQVTMSADRAVAAAFSSPPSSFVLTVQGATNGSGSVTSSPAGITCAINGGTAGAGCGTSFPTAATVTLSATAASGSFLKAWSGAGCDTSGTGAGTTTGTCTLAMNKPQSVVLSFATSADEYRVGSWSAPFAWPAVAIHAHLLPNGKVLTFGRMPSGGVPVLWDPADPGLFQSTSQPGDLFCSGHSLLPDGRLLVSGGHAGTDLYGTRTTFIYDGSGGWSQGPDMQNGRWYPTNTTLANGEVLTVSGTDTAALYNRIPEVWDNGNWRPLTSASRLVQLYPMMFAAPDGRVFMAGPEQQTAWLNTTGTGSWTNGPMSAFGPRDYGSAVMYDAGKILLVGGGAPTETAEVIDINAGAGAAWRSVAPMAVARRQLNATLMADGSVLVTGGSNSPGFNIAPTDSRVLTPERWDPVTEQWTPLAGMAHHRVYHSTALLLPDGRILSAGSGQPAAPGLADDYTAEIFTPPYLYGLDGTLAARPVITDAPTQVAYGQAFTVQTPQAASIVRATWIRLSSVTHAFNQNQRMNNLTVAATGTSSVTVTAPASANLAPPGHYMLFLIDASGVPSVARIIRVF